MKRYIAVAITLSSLFVCNSQTDNDFNDFRKSLLENFTAEKQRMNNDYNSFRNKINADYSDFLRKAWRNIDIESPIEKPKDENPVPPIDFDENAHTTPIVIDSKPLPAPLPEESPEPIAPIIENDVVANSITLPYYGLSLSIRASSECGTMTQLSANSVADQWSDLSDGRLDNSLYDLIAIRNNNKLCDWAYLQLLDSFGKTVSTNKNTSTLITAWLLCQSGYQIRLGNNSGNLVLLYACHHTVFDRPFYIVDGIKFYPLERTSSDIEISNAIFKGERPLSLKITSEQVFGMSLSAPRTIKSKRYADVEITTRTNEHLIDFYNSFPSSAIGGNPLTRWAIYAETPFAKECSNAIYPTLDNILAGKSELEKVEILLNLVQTGFVYEYDDKVWGGDRAFFAEETLYYPFCDCEDRSILFSRLVRDLCGLEVALIYYPNHLATAVKFKTAVNGDAVNIDGVKFIVCDPTYIGARVGHQMPGLDYSGIRSIVLKK